MGIAFPARECAKAGAAASLSRLQEALFHQANVGVSASVAKEGNVSPEPVTCGVLVAGSGAAGFAAALTARLRGLDVLKVEKEPLFGGTTAYSAGVVWIPSNSHQAAAGVSDSR